MTADGEERRPVADVGTIVHDQCSAWPSLLRRTVRSGVSVASNKIMLWKLGGESARHNKLATVMLLLGRLSGWDVTASRCAPLCLASNLPRVVRLRASRLARWHRTRLAPSTPPVPCAPAPAVAWALRCASPHRVNQPPLGGTKYRSTCCNRKFHAFQMYVAYIFSGCCKGRSGVAYLQ
jgi:hypothetical protein